MKIAIVGCGYVSHFYAATLGKHPRLELAGAFDRDPGNLDRFTRAHGVSAYARMEALLADPQIALVLNLTNPRDHVAVTTACLEAGKHVYSEKPLGMTYDDARQLTLLARSKGLSLSSAPCSVLSETAQTLWKAIDEGVVGKVRLVYANFDDGILVPGAQPWRWTNAAGVPWPARDEFEIGCTYEHAGYALTWLAAFFGPARAVTGFAAGLVPDKGIAVGSMAPDFTVGCVEYADGIVARLTCGLLAPEDKSMVVIGDEGTLSVSDLRDDYGPVRIHRFKAGRWQSALERRIPALKSLALFDRDYPALPAATGARVGPEKPVDFLRGPDEMAQAIEEDRPCRLSADFSAHIVELVEAIQHPERFANRKTMQSSFDPMVPLGWRRGA